MLVDRATTELYILWQKSMRIYQWVYVNAIYHTVLGSRPTGRYPWFWIQNLSYELDFSMQEKRIENLYFQWFKIWKSCAGISTNQDSHGNRGW